MVQCKNICSNFMKMDLIVKTRQPQMGYSRKISTHPSLIGFWWEGGVKKQPHLSGVGADFSGITQSSYCIRLHHHQVLKYSFHVIFFFHFFSLITWSCVNCTPAGIDTSLMLLLQWWTLILWLNNVDKHFELKLLLCPNSFEQCAGNDRLSHCELCGSFL